MHICSLFGIKKKAKWKFSGDKQGHQCCHKWDGFKGYITNPEHDDAEKVIAEYHWQ